MFLAALAAGHVGADARAELRDLVITRREPYAGGASFGDVGPYEKLTGAARFAVDPAQALVMAAEWAPSRVGGYAIELWV